MKRVLRAPRPGAAARALGYGSACLILASVGTPVSAETCDQFGASSIDATCAFTGGVVTGCTPDCSDTFKINGSVTQTDDVAMTGANGDTLFVRNGGSWNSDGFDLTYDTGGLRVSAGGTFEMAGPGFREWAPTPTPSTQLEPSEWPMGDYVPCPDPSGVPDCNGNDNNIVRIAYEPTRPDADVPAALAALSTDDVVCGYFDPTTMGTTAAAWSNSCFEVSNVDATCAGSADCYFEIEMDQSWLGQPSRDYPLPRRRVIETAISGGYSGNLAFGGQPTAAVEVGQRRVCLIGVAATIAAAVAKNEDLVGRFLRFSDGSPNQLPLPWSYVINGLEHNAPSCDPLLYCNGNCHLVSISDPRGFQEGHAVTERVWIDYGFLSSDRFAVLAEPPVLSGLHAPGGFAGAVQVAGTLTLRNAVAVDIGTFDLTDATLEALEWLFVSDPTPNFNAIYDTQVYVFRLLDNTLNLDAIHHINVVGGPGFATCDNVADTGPGTGGDSCNPGLHVFMSRGAQYRFEDISISHNEDDCMAGIQGGGGTLDVERLYCGPSGDEPDSTNFIDLFDQNNHVLFAQDIICANCSNESGNNAVAIFKLISPTVPLSTLNRVSIVGAQGPFNDNFGREAAEFSNLFLSGHRTATNGKGPANLEFFVIEDTHRDLDLAPEVGAYWPADSLARLNGGIVRNSSLSGNGSVLEHPNNGVIDNVLFLNLDKSFDDPTSNAFVRLDVDGTKAFGTYRNATFAYQAGVSPVRLDAIFDANDVDDKSYGVHDLLIADTPGSVTYGVSTDDITDLQSDGWCLFNAGVIEDLADFPADTVLDQDPGFLSPATGDFRTPSDGPCGSSGIKRGIDTPGVRENGYYLSALHLSPKAVNQVDGIEWRFTGIAQGGAIAFTIDAVALVVLTSVGESSVDVAANVAAAINGNAALMSRGINASSAAGSVFINDLVSNASVDDAGLNQPVISVVALSRWGLALLVFALPGAALAVAVTRRTPTR